MGENGDVAVTEADETADRGVAAGVAIGAHGVEPGRLGPAVDEHRRRQAGPVGFTLERRHRLVARGHDDQAVDAARDQRLDAAALLRRILARGDDEKIIAVAFGERFDPMHEAGEKHVGDVGNHHADEAGRLAAQRAGRAIQPIAERRDRFGDPFRRLASPTGRLPLTTLEAVATETPARDATSRMVGALPAIVRSLHRRRRVELVASFSITFSPSLAVKPPNAASTALDRLRAGAENGLALGAPAGERRQAAQDEFGVGDRLPADS